MYDSVRTIHTNIIFALTTLPSQAYHRYASPLIVCRPQDVLYLGKPAYRFQVVDVVECCMVLLWLLYQTASPTLDCFLCYLLSDNNPLAISLHGIAYRRVDRTHIITKKLS